MISRTTVGAALMGVAVAGFGPTVVPAQTPKNAGAKEANSAVDEDLFQVRLARLRLQAADAESEDAIYVKKLLSEAEGAYRAGDLDLANLRLLEAEVYLETFVSSDSVELDETEGLDSPPGFSTEESTLHLQAFAGLDLWTERLAVESEFAPSSGVQGAGNPGAGLRADFSTVGRLGTAQGYAEARTSRDYAFALADVDFAPVATGMGEPRVELRLTGTDYHHGVGTDYFQAQLLARWDLSMTRAWIVTPVAELWRTRYARGEETFFADFDEGTYGLRTNVSLPGGSWLEAEARRVRRHYGSAVQPDFDGADISTGIGFADPGITSILWLSYQVRNFGATPKAGTSEGSYRDFYADARLHWVVRRPWGLEGRLSLEKRGYRVPTPATPDFLETKVRLYAIWQPEYGRSVSAGPIFRWRSSPEFSGARWSRWEDYRSWGFGVDLELLQGEHWTLYWTNTVESRVHPYGPPDGLPGLSLYDDRLISNSLLLFSWRFSEGWELTATVNLDREDDRRQPEGDVQNTLASLQCVREIF